MALLILVSSLRDVPWSLLCMLLSLVLLGLSVFFGAGPVPPDGRFYQRYNLFAGGVFFFVLAVALGGK